MTQACAVQTLILEGEPVGYTVVYSRTGKRNRIRVDAEGVTVILPQRTPAEQAAAFLRQNSAWVLQQIAFVRRMGSLRIPPAALPPHSILLRGVPTSLDIIPEDSGRSYGLIEEQSGKLCVRVPRSGMANPQKTLEAWLRRQARMDIETRIRIRAGEMRQSPGRIYIMDQRTKWGGCSARGNLTFNWRLVMAPPEVLDYVVVHELAHLAELNHSTRFWLIVRSHCPEFERYKVWLKENQAGLRQNIYQDMGTISISSGGQS